MPEPTLDSLLSDAALDLRLVSGPAEALARPLRWVHSSDLADPTPFLADDLALLTTGSQLAELGAADYVALLTARGVVGLGFGTGVRRPDVPDDLVEACAAAGLPLFEVPYGTPFIAVARAHAEAIAAQAYARRSWALDTQRALAAAALRRHGLAAIITELGRRLDAWVALYDAAGSLSTEHPPAGIPRDVRAELDAHVADLLGRGAESGRSLSIGGHALQLFTLGRARGLRGVIALATGALDAEARAVVTSVIAMAGLALEQTEHVVAARRRLNSELLTTLLHGDADLAPRVLGTLPTGAVVVAVAVDALPAALEEWWERRRAERGSRAFLAVGDEGVVICAPEADAPLLDEAAERFGIRIGVSEVTDLAAFAQAQAQALSAARRAGTGAARFAEAAASGIRAVLSTDDARLIAETRLAPLRAHDASLPAMLRVWLAHDARFEQAAAALGMHRHTLRARVADASRLLGADLSAFPARAELWTLLEAAGE